jgi:hypothetical protein
MIPIQSEANLQQQCVKWFDMQYPQYSRYLFHIRNGGSIKSAREGLKFKRMGVRKGIPDLFLSLPTSEWHGMYIELKKKGGKPSHEQLENCRHFRNVRYECEIIDDFDTFVRIVKLHMFFHEKYVENLSK